MLDREFEYQSLLHEVGRLEEQLSWEQNAINEVNDILSSLGVPTVGAEGHGKDKELTLVQRVTRMARDYELGSNLRLLLRYLGKVNIYCCDKDDNSDTTVESEIKGKDFYYDDVHLEAAMRGAVHHATDRKILGEIDG